MKEIKRVKRSFRWNMRGFIAKHRKRFKFKHSDTMTVREIIDSRRYRAVLQLRYVDTGVNKMSYLRYSVFGSFVAGFDIGLIYSLVFGIIAYWIGRWWYKSGMVLIEAEMSNQFNKFQRQMRKEIVKDG